MPDSSGRDEYLRQRRDLLSLAQDALAYAQSAVDFYEEMAQTQPEPLDREWAIRAKQTMESIARAEERYIKDLKVHIQEIEALPPDDELLFLGGLEDT